MGSDPSPPPSSETATEVARGLTPFTAPGRDHSGSDQSQLGEVLAQLRRHGGDAGGGVATQILGGLVLRQVAPALERAPRHRAHGHQLVLEDQRAAGRAVLLGPFRDVEQGLTHLHDALDHPVERPARQQLVAPLGRLEGAVEQLRASLAGLASLSQPLDLPGRQVLDRTCTPRTA